MKKLYGTLLLSLCLLLLSNAAGNAAETLDNRLAELRGIENRGDLDHLGLEKLRTLGGTEPKDILSLPQADILWLLSYGLDMYDSMLYSLVGKSERGARRQDEKLGEFTDRFNTIWNTINSAYTALSEKSTEPSPADKLFDLLKKGASPQELLPVTTEGLKYTWEIVKGWFAESEKEEAFLTELKTLRAENAALLENAPDSPWNFALLSYARLRRQSADYVKYLNQFEIEIARHPVPYEKTRVLNDGILSIKQELAAYDAKLRKAVVDIPVFTVQFYSKACIDSAKGIFSDDTAAVLEAGALFARTAPLINLAVDDNVRKGWTEIAGALKDLLNEEQYDELKSISQAVNMMWDFDDVPRTINWP